VSKICKRECEPPKNEKVVVLCQNAHGAEQAPKVDCREIRVQRDQIAPSTSPTLMSSITPPNKNLRLSPNACSSFVDVRIGRFMCRRRQFLAKIREAVFFSAITVILTFSPRRRHRRSPDLH
jgi:hypothetical protein